MTTGWERLSLQYGIYRDARNGWIAGVCIGLAHWLGVKTSWVRLGFVLFGLVLHAIPAVLLYLALAVLMKPAPQGAMQGAMQPPQPDQYTPRFTPPPAYTPTLAPLQARFAALDARLNQLEAAVTSEDISLRRKFRDIGI